MGSWSVSGVLVGYGYGRTRVRQAFRGVCGWRGWIGWELEGHEDVVGEDVVWIGSAMYVCINCEVTLNKILQDLCSRSVLRCILVYVVIPFVASNTASMRILRRTNISRWRRFIVALIFESCRVR